MCNSCELSKLKVSLMNTDGKTSVNLKALGAEIENT